MTKQLKVLLAGSLIFVGAAVAVHAHCQIPCGIYGDDTRFSLMREHVTTIEKSMTQIIHIGKDKAQNSNQLVRWVNNKESHSDELAEIVTAYFMAQRVKPASEDDKAGHAKYVEKVTLLHQILVSSMKAKQSTDVAVCVKLRSLIDDFEKAYKGK